MALPVPSEHAVREAEAGGKWVFGIFQRFLRLAAEQQKHATLIEAQANHIKEQGTQIVALRDAVRTLQAREAALIARVEAEALRAASASTSELARRVGFLEGRASRD